MHLYCENVVQWPVRVSACHHLGVFQSSYLEYIENIMRIYLLPALVHEGS